MKCWCRLLFWHVEVELSLVQQDSVPSHQMRCMITAATSHRTLAYLDRGEAARNKCRCHEASPSDGRFHKRIKEMVFEGALHVGACADTTG